MTLDDTLNSVRLFPKRHLYIAATVTALSGVLLAFIPSTEVEATRSRVELVKPITVKAPDRPPTDQADLTATLSTPTISDTEQSRIGEQPTASVDQAITTQPMINWVEYSVRSGDNLTKIFKRAGLGPRDVYEISSSDKASEHLHNLRPGQTLALVIEGDQLQRLKLVQNRLESIEFVRQDDQFRIDKLARTPDIQTRFVSGDIQNSLYLGAKRAGLSEKLTMELAEIFGWDIDFALDIRKGDSFRVLFEEQLLDGEKIGEGDILAAEFTNNGETFSAVRYQDSKGDINYYTPDGHSMRKAFLRSPVDFRRISSNFTPERYHPVLGIKRPHRGTDYAAATGTPIKAAGDGKVIWKGTKGGYGRTIIIQHGNNITTLYGHMSKYSSAVASGTRVKQGQIIGYVGMSGTATGPHLHYEFRVNGAHKNPVTVKLPDAEPIAKAERSRFDAATQQLIAELQIKAVQQVASNDATQPNG